MFEMPKAPYLGVAYYPEDWPEEEIDKDIKRMKDIYIAFRWQIKLWG